MHRKGEILNSMLAIEELDSQKTAKKYYLLMPHLLYELVENCSLQDRLHEFQFG